MKFILVVFLAISPWFTAYASDEKNEYFYGQARIINLNTPMHSDATPMLLLKKTTIRSKSLLIETATTLDKEGVMKDHIVYAKVSGQTLTISDAEDSIEGTGLVSGEEWNWNLLKFSMVTKKGGIRIEDINFRTPDRLIARKVLSLPNGDPFMLWDIEANEISEAAYQALYSEMHGF